MKKNAFNKELSGMDLTQLVGKVAELKSKLFALRLSSSTAHVKNYAEFKSLRRDIARVLTALRSK